MITSSVEQNNWIKEIWEDLDDEPASVVVHNCQSKFTSFIPAHLLHSAEMEPQQLIDRIKPSNDDKRSESF